MLDTVATFLRGGDGKILVNDSGSLRTYVATEKMVRPMIYARGAR